MSIHHYNSDLGSTKVRGDLSPICLKPEVAQARADKLAKLDYYEAGANTNCPQGAAIATAKECLEAIKALGLGCGKAPPSNTPARIDEDDDEDVSGSICAGSGISLVILGMGVVAGLTMIP